LKIKITKLHKFDGVHKINVFGTLLRRVTTYQYGWCR